MSFSVHAQLTAVTMGHKPIYLLRIYACAEVHVHCCLLISTWVDQGVVYPFDYPFIRPAS